MRPNRKCASSSFMKKSMTNGMAVPMRRQPSATFAASFSRRLCTPIASKFQESSGDPLAPQSPPM